MALKPSQEPHPPRQGDRDRKPHYTDWEGIRPLNAEDLARNFDREDAWHQRFSTLHPTSPDARGRTRSGIRRLMHSMAIETGVIEGLYNPAHSVTQTLLREGFKVEFVPREGVDVEPKHLVAVLTDHYLAHEMVGHFAEEDRPISKHTIRELHARITAHQEAHDAVDSLGRRVQRKLRRGVWKDFPNNPTRPDGTVHLYAPPEQVDSQLELLLELYGRYRDTQHPLLTGAWLHHRFMQIHPFADGNGRTGRMLLNWQLQHAGWPPVSVHRQDRNAYLHAMEEADAGDLSVLVDFLIAIARQSVRTVMHEFSAEERLQILGPEDPDFVYRREDDWRNGV